jgi:hypothetical protein
MNEGMAFTNLVDGVRSSLLLLLLLSFLEEMHAEVKSKIPRGKKESRL